jgi:ssDNA-binding Zn-finger/Zn-ribbon topoisomerase 1
VPYLQCPECRLTVSASAFSLREHCPRCRRLLEPLTTIRREPKLVLRPPAARARRVSRPVA